MKEVLKYCIWLFKPIFKYGLIFTASLFLIISAIQFTKTQFQNGKEQIVLRKN